MTRLRPQSAGKAESLFVANLKPFSTASAHCRQRGAGAAALLVSRSSLFTGSPLSWKMTAEGITFHGPHHRARALRPALPVLRRHREAAEGDQSQDHAGRPIGARAGWARPTWPHVERRIR